MIRLHQDEWVEGAASVAAPRVPRLAEPELRSRVAGYLRHAPDLGGGLRTDGVWAWPDTLARGVLDDGLGPSRSQLDHMAAQAFVPPASLPPDLHADLVRAVSPPARPCLVDDSGALWQRSAAGLEPLEPIGATAVRAMPRLPVGRLVEVSDRTASGMLDRAADARYQQLLHDGREAPPPGRGEPALARVFDGEDPTGRPWFSPQRSRIVDPARRDRVARYLGGGRLVVRATGAAPDPLSSSGAPVVPLGWRTDGYWVWQDALAFYVRARGVAPELPLLRHIEEQAGATTPPVSDDRLRRAAEVVRSGPPPWPPRRSATYYAGLGLLVRADGDEYRGAEILDADLRWRPAHVPWRGPRHELARIDPAEAVRLIDRLAADAPGLPAASALR